MTISITTITAVVLVSALLLAYAYAGYPLLVALLARYRARPVREDAHWTPTVSVLLPVHAAAAPHLAAKLESLLGQDYPAEALEILIYLDGDAGEAGTIARAHAAREPRIHVLGGGARRGKPHALNAMLREARGEVLLMADARQVFEPGVTRALVRRLADPTVGCVSGRLELEGDTGAGVYWRYERWIRENEARFRSTVGVSGAIYAIRRTDMAPLPEDTILDDVWVPMRLALAGRRSVLAPDAVARDTAFGDGREFGRKVRTLAGNYQLFSRMPRLLLPGANPLWLETLSHKVARLLCPFALIALLLATAATSAPGLVSGSTVGLGILRALFFAQVLFYVGAAAGRRAGKVPAVARSFVVLNAAALLSLWRFLRRAQQVTW